MICWLILLYRLVTFFWLYQSLLFLFVLGSRYSMLNVLALAYGFAIGWMIVFVNSQATLTWWPLVPCCGGFVMDATPSGTLRANSNGRPPSWHHSTAGHLLLFLAANVGFLTHVVARHSCGALWANWSGEGRISRRALVKYCHTWQFFIWTWVLNCLGLN